MMLGVSLLLLLMRLGLCLLLLGIPHGSEILMMSLDIVANVTVATREELEPFLVDTKEIANLKCPGLSTGIQIRFNHVL